MLLVDYSGRDVRGDALETRRFWFRLHFHCVPLRHSRQHLRTHEVFNENVPRDRGSTHPLCVRRYGTADLLFADHGVSCSRLRQASIRDHLVVGPHSIVIYPTVLSQSNPPFLDHQSFGLFVSSCPSNTVLKARLLP